MLQLITILNRCHRFPGFVYPQARFSSDYYVGVRESAWVQRIFTAAKIGGLALVIGAAFLAPHAARVEGIGAIAFSYAGIGFAMTACLMAYNGWSFVSFMAGE